MSKTPVTSPTLEVINNPENQARIAKFQAQAAALDKKQEMAAKIFDPVALLQRSTAIHEFNHPTLGVIKFGELVLKDSAVLEKCKTPAEKTAMTLYLMLKKAYQEMPKYTPENILEFYDAFPLAEGAALLQFISEQPSFLPKKPLKTG